MLKLYLLLVVCYSFSVQGFKTFKPEGPKNLEDNEVIKKFIEIVEAHHLNVSIIAHQNEYFITTGLLEDITAYYLEYPENSVTVKVGESKLTEAIGKEFLDLAAKHKIVASTNIIPIDTFDNKTINNKNYDADTDIYALLYQIQKNVDGDILKTKDYLARYNFIIPGSDGKNETYIALAGNADIEIDEKKNFSDEELNYAKELLLEVILMVEDLDDHALLLKHQLNEKFPKQAWQVLINPGDYYVGSEKFAELNAVGTKYVLFTL